VKKLTGSPAALLGLPAQMPTTLSIWRWPWLINRWPATAQSNTLEPIWVWLGEPTVCTQTSPSNASEGADFASVRYMKVLPEARAESSG
jgi:hypothetical protein